VIWSIPSSVDLISANKTKQTNNLPSWIELWKIITWNVQMSFFFKNISLSSILNEKEPLYTPKFKKIQHG
jgi:hypothetical protein